MPASRVRKRQPAPLSDPAPTTALLGLLGVLPASFSRGLESARKLRFLTLAEAFSRRSVPLVVSDHRTIG